jgi:hypothetical protein
MNLRFPKDWRSSSFEWLPEIPLSVVATLTNVIIWNVEFFQCLDGTLYIPYFIHDLVRLKIKACPVFDNLVQHLTKEFVLKFSFAGLVEVVEGELAAAVGTLWLL